jgi:hypothetical protein
VWSRRARPFGRDQRHPDRARPRSSRGRPAPRGGGMRIRRLLLIFALTRRWSPVRPSVPILTIRSRIPALRTTSSPIC